MNERVKRYAGAVYALTAALALVIWLAIDLFMIRATKWLKKRGFFSHDASREYDDHIDMDGR